MHSRGKQFVTASFICMISAFILFGCGGKLFSFKGDKVTQKDLLVQLKDGNQQGVWKNTELEITYQYQIHAKTMQFSGTTELAGVNKRFRHLTVYLLFLDDQGIVIEDALIYSAGNNRPLLTAPPMDFEKTMPLPDGARSISFTYDLSPINQR